MRSKVMPSTATSFACQRSPSDARYADDLGAPEEEEHLVAGDIAIEGQVSEVRVQRDTQADVRGFEVEEIHGAPTADDGDAGGRPDQLLAKRAARVVAPVRS